MQAHVELKGYVANTGFPLCQIGGQGEIAWTHLLWKNGRESMLEFLQAAVCADELEKWRGRGAGSLVFAVGGMDSL